ncbi:MAG: OsmC family protein [Anaerolineaceae bacterium]
MEARVTWKGRMTFEGTSDSGFTVPLGTFPEVGGDNDGFRPMELFAIGLGGCTGMDVISIMAKKRMDVKTFEVKVNAKRSEEHPKVFSDIEIEYVVSGHDLNREWVERAVELSETKYCPAQAMLVKVVPIHHKIIIIETD